MSFRAARLPAPSLQDRCSCGHLRVSHRDVFPRECGHLEGTRKCRCDAFRDDPKAPREPVCTPLAEVVAAVAAIEREATLAGITKLPAATLDVLAAEAQLDELGLELQAGRCERATFSGAVANFARAWRSAISASVDQNDPGPWSDAVMPPGRPVPGYVSNLAGPVSIRGDRR